jgi:drug/metabolite transporter (DMT)-like permease
MSQWIGFHFWYGAMAKIGIARAGQIQLLQSFFILLFSVLLLGAALNAQQFIFAGLITLQ